jgi:hypothetical protein
MERRWPAVDADVRDPTGRADELGAELERCRDADGFDCHVDAEPVGQFEHARDCVLAAVVDRRVGVEAGRLGESRLDDVQVGAADRRAADADDRVSPCLDRRVRDEFLRLLGGP